MLGKRLLIPISLAAALLAPTPIAVSAQEAKADSLEARIRELEARLDLLEGTLDAPFPDNCFPPARPFLGGGIRAGPSAAAFVAPA